MRRMVKINVNLRTAKYGIPLDLIEKSALYTLRSLGVKSGVIDFAFVNDRAMARFNKKYKGRAHFTDVLAFPYNDFIVDDNGRRMLLLGEVIISLDRANVQAKRFGKNFLEEVFLYVIHGILHVMGYDDIEPDDKAEMDKKQLLLLERFLKNHKTEVAGYVEKRVS